MISALPASVTRIPPGSRRGDSLRDGGEGGIRTRDGLPRTAFPVRRHSPLGDLSKARSTLEPPSCHDVPPHGRPWEGSVRAPERAHPRVRKRGAEALTHPGSFRRWNVAERAGFEPAVLSHTAF